MKFGIFYELQLPRPWGPDSEYELYQNALSQLELADALGYDYAWEVEHHFLEEYSHSSAPEVFLAAASQRTKRIRLGHGIFQLTTNHPAKVAEKVSALDLISQRPGRARHGRERLDHRAHPVQRRFDEKRAIFEDAVRCLMPMFGDGGVEYHGPYFDFPLRNVLPKPRQKPHPPLWTACSQLPTIAYAGEKGIGALGFQFVSADAAHAWVHAYYNGMTKRLAKLADYPVNPNIALVSMFMCAPTDEEARAKADGATFFQFCLRYYNSADRSRPPPGAVDMWDEYGKWKAANRRAGRARALGRPDRLPRDHPAQAAQVRGLAHRPGDPAEPGRPQHATRTSATASSCSPRR